MAKASSSDRGRTRLMSQLISEIWVGLRDAGIPEVMLYLPDYSASRCHWDDTMMLGGVLVAVVADQERKIVRLLPVDSCTGIGVASPKGVDPSGYKAVVQAKLKGEALPTGPVEDPVAFAPPPAPLPPPPAPVVEIAAPVATPENPANRWGGMPAKMAGRHPGAAIPQGSSR
jgi:hypothetical protein